MKAGNAENRRLVELARRLLPVSWLLAAAGCYGPWVAHRTAALTLTGPDLAEFVKFLPAFTDGSLHVARQVFYLPVVVTVLCVALLAGSAALQYPWPVRASALVLALPLSTQLLPPAWSPASLLSAEFRLQPVVLGVCWLAVAGFWLLGRFPLQRTALVAVALTIPAALLPTWQFCVVKPQIDAAYGQTTSTGWGAVVCVAALLVSAAASATLALTGRQLRS